MIIQSYLLDFETNCYVIYNEENKQAVIIDAGSRAKYIEHKISQMGYTPVAVLLTHGHFDHAGACAELQESGIPIYIYEKEYDFTFTDKNCAHVFSLPFKEFKADYTFTRGKLSVGGLEFTVIPTPGHTHGSVCFMLGDIIFTGDTIFEQSYGRYDLITGSRKDLISSIVDTLFHLKGDYKLYPGHGDETTLEKERDTNFIWNEL